MGHVKYVWTETERNGGLKMYKAIYKCRLCGEEYMAGVAGDGNTASNCMKNIVKRGYFS